MADDPDAPPRKGPRLSKTSPATTEDPDAAPMVSIEDLDKLHEAACSEGKLMYTDPATGYMVMTRLAHEKRGRCCGCGCRHCLFGHANVKDKANKIQQPAWLHMPEQGLDPGGVTLLMWSGGKDSFLALRALMRGRLGGDTRKVALLTTFDAATRMVAHQEVHATDIQRQAAHLDVALVGCPLLPGHEYVSRIASALKVVRSSAPVTHFASGDLHLVSIREWRERQLVGALGLEGIVYPVWSDSAGSNYPDLEKDLVSSGVPCAVSAVASEEAARAGIAVGDLYTPQLAAKLVAAGLDAFGENGEIHSLAQVWEVPRAQALGIRSCQGIGDALRAGARLLSRG